MLIFSLNALSIYPLKLCECQVVLVLCCDCYFDVIIVCLLMQNSIICKKGFQQARCSNLSYIFLQRTMPSFKVKLYPLLN